MINDVAFQDIKLGDTAELSKTISEADVYAYAGLSMDFNPLHVDEEFSRTTRFGRRIAHGMLSAGLISAVIGTALPGKNSIYLGQTLKFTAPVFIGDTLTARAEVIEKREDKGILKLKTTVFNQKKETVIEGEATVMKK